MIVDVVGLEENMIAEPSWPEIPNVRIYPDQPQGISRDDGQWVLGHKEFRYAIVPEHEGELILPELTVHWWDTVNKRQQTAFLPAHVLKVQASAMLPLPQQLPVMPDAADAIAGDSTGARAGHARYWRLLAILFAVLWLLTLLAAWRIRGQRELAVNGNAPSRSENESLLLGRLKRSCERGDASQARQALAIWLSRYGPDGMSGSLLEFASELEHETLRASVYAMDSDGFRPDTEVTWNSRQFCKQFEAWRKSWRSAAAAQKAPATDLYARENRRGG